VEYSEDKTLAHRAYWQELIRQSREELQTEQALNVVERDFKPTTERTDNAQTI
jgi:hypothetical protein